MILDISLSQLQVSRGYHREIRAVGHFHEHVSIKSRVGRLEWDIKAGHALCSSSVPHRSPVLDLFGLEVASDRLSFNRRRRRGCNFILSAFSVQNDDGEGRMSKPLKLQSKKLAVFVSGGGSNFRALQSAIEAGKIRGEIVVVVSDKPGCGGCLYALEKGISVSNYPRGKNAPDGLSVDDLIHKLRSCGVQCVILAGYMRLLPPELVKAFPRAIFNIHPALLPAFGGKGFYGQKVHEAVVRSGVRYSGPTVHFVDEKYDTGPIVAQRAVPVLPSDTPKDIAARVLKEEHILYVEVISAFCEDRILWRDDGVPFIQSAPCEGST